MSGHPAVMLWKSMPSGARRLNLDTPASDIEASSATRGYRMIDPEPPPRQDRDAGSAPFPRN